ncbi:LLM class flavin-dependent oxidoreductase [Actinoallomurus rhizosphaericola]|uniref:LLM class flavin-dependent oxidoreductase n=1 Tax=Actinoallomurus rhizosphaericola TaxID=2952536 RepID=UPI0020920C60|nr:LLM class flavin-dependent oxidoreductase [Actinoallomurus rhizosphaericola]MCO5998439.1 LLM class flavin-dependent oxidoreductase [Actinoallomurus rhizosphaericola]
MPFSPAHPRDATVFASQVSKAGVRRLWLGESIVLDPFQALSYAAAASIDISFGIGVALTPLRTPLAAAMQARTLAIASQKEVMVGFGPGSPGFQDAVLGSPYRRPRAVTSTYVDAVREVLTGEPSTAWHPTGLRARMHLPDLPTPSIRLGMGVLRPPMAHSAGSAADVAITWLAPAEYLRREIVPVVNAGAAESHRAIPRKIAIVPTALRRSGVSGTDVVMGSCGRHLALEHYASMLRLADIKTDPSSPEASARALIAGGAFIYGSPDEVAHKISSYFEAGIDEVVLNLTGVCVTSGYRSVLQDLTSILDALKC